MKFLFHSQQKVVSSEKTSYNRTLALLIQICMHKSTKYKIVTRAHASEFQRQKCACIWISKTQIHIKNTDGIYDINAIQLDQTYDIGGSGCQKTDAADVAENIKPVCHTEKLFAEQKNIFCL